MDKDTRPYNQRLPELKNELILLCKKYRIEIMSTLRAEPSALVAQITFVDMNNPEEMKKLGLAEKDDTPSLLVN